MKNLVLSPSLDLTEFTGNLLLEDKESLCKNLIIFPGKRPASFLRKYISEKLKLPFESPLIFSIDEYIDFAYQSLKLPDRKINDIDGISLLFKLNQQDKLIGKEGLTLDEFLPWGLKIFSDFEEMYIEKIKPEQIKGIEIIAEEKIPPNIKENLTKLSVLYTSFYEYLFSHNLSTRAIRYRKVAEDVRKIDITHFKRVLIIGFFALTKSETILFKELKNYDKVNFIFQKGNNIERIISALEIEAEEKESPPQRPTIEFHKAMDIHGEIFALNHVLRQKKNFDSKDLIVLPLSNTLFPLLQQTLGFAKDYNISLGYPLFRTQVYGVMEKLSRLLTTKEGDNYFLPDYLSFVLHPYVKNIRLDSASYLSRIIFHTIEEKAKSLLKTFILLEEIEENSNIINECLKKITGLNDNITESEIKGHLKNIHQVMIRPFEKLKDIGDFCDKLLKFFSFISMNSSANLHAYTAPFIEIILKVLYELRTSELKNERFKEVDSYFHLLRNYIRQIHYPFTGTPVKGLQVLGFLETRNLKFERVYFLDVNEGIIPATRKEDTILPYIVRKTLELPTHEEREKISSYYFETLIDGAKEAHIFYVESADKEKSRFVERLIWRLQKEKMTLDFPKIDETSFKVNFAQTNPSEIKKSDRLIKYIQDKLVFSPTALDTYLHCPLEFYYKEILKLEEKEDISDDIDRRNIGKIVHTVLQKYFNQKIGEKLIIKEKDYQNIEGIVEEEFYSHSDRGPIYLIKLQVKKRMRDVLEYHQKHCKETMILKCEDRKPTEVEVNMSGGKKVRLKGKIDRVEQRGEETFIVDYKTGRQAYMPDYEKFISSSRQEWHKTLKSVQLPFYLLLYLQKNIGIPIEKINSSLLLLGGKNIEEKQLFDEKIKKKQKELPQKKEILAGYQKAIFTLIEEILNPDVSFTAASEAEKKCPLCIFRVICGRQWLVKEW
ncbi:MAG: hypothetical protein A2W05_03180 [Candidatus Schekmanbacteria bacterium RBG_16_38_10]|uniref:PD-(D/E)XK endonuclease-like domain-containing protein n=1 Tax=Candidatus Schekmanbacteria bacterium RBG_16_38_10 TaxID=1817879 RepID=A0A1F7RWC5_9BACT|nr:MAG: hypothetical protein A2W05_03180 [Candidatus Schekmanbacteria bacterium RBG_16_38_10]